MAQEYSLPLPYGVKILNPKPSDPRLECTSLAAIQNDPTYYVGLSGIANLAEPDGAGGYTKYDIVGGNKNDGWVFRPIKELLESKWTRAQIIADPVKQAWYKEGQTFREGQIWWKCLKDGPTSLGHFTKIINTNYGTIHAASTLGGLGTLLPLMGAIQAIWFDDPAMYDPSKYYCFNKLKNKDNSVQVFLSETSSASENPLSATIICSFTSVGKTGQELISATEYNSSGKSCKALINWDAVSGLEASTLSWEKFGINPQVFEAPAKAQTIAKAYADTLKTATDADIAKRTNFGVIHGASTYGGNNALRPLANAIQAIWFDDPIMYDPTKYYCFNKLKNDGNAQFFLSEVSAANETPLSASIICYFSAAEKTGQELISATEYNSSGKSCKALINWDAIVGIDSGSMQWVAFGINPQVFEAPAKAQTIAKAYADTLKTATDADIATRTNFGVIHGASTYGGNNALRPLANAIQAIWFDDPTMYDPSKYYCFNKLKNDGNAQFFLSEVSAANETPLSSTIICLFSASEKTGQELISATEYNSSGKSCKALINWDAIVGIDSGSMQWVAFGINPQVFELPLNAVLKSNSYTDAAIASAGGITSQMVRKEGTNLYIASKWDDGNDLIILVNNDELNNRFVPRKISLAANTNGVPSPNVTRTPDTVLKEVGETSDDIGPLNVGGWTGGGHQYPGNYDDPKYPTANLVSYKMYADDMLLDDNITSACKEVKVVAVHELYQPDTTPDETNTVLFREHITMVIKNGSIVLDVEIEPVVETYVYDYMGMQTIGLAWHEKMYFAHSGISTDLLDFSNNYNAGDATASANLEKWILCNADKSICMAGAIDLTKGLGSIRNTNIGTENVAYTASNKTYHKLIKSKTLYVGTRYAWRGVYNYFKNKSSDFDFCYLQHEGKNTYLLIDNITNTTGTKVAVIQELQGKEIEVINEDATITVDTYVSPTGLVVACTGYGNAKIKILN